MVDLHLRLLLSTRLNHAEEPEIRALSRSDTGQKLTLSNLVEWVILGPKPTDAKPYKKLK